MENSLKKQLMCVCFIMKPDCAAVSLVIAGIFVDNNIVASDGIRYFEG